MSRTIHISKGMARGMIAALMLILAAIVVLAAIAFWDYHRYEHLTDQPTTSFDDQQSEIYVDGVKYTPKNDIDTILLLGVDKYESAAEHAEYINNQHADVLMLLIVDHAAKENTLLQLNRDTMTQIQTLGVMGDDGGTITAQLALSHAYGTGANDSCRNAAKAVSNLLYGADVEHYLSLKLDAVAILNDAVGGVTVELMDDFTLLDPSFTQGTTVQLQGEQATAYVRARGEVADKTNIHRLERQRQYMTAWTEAFESASAAEESFVESLVMDVNPYMVSDLTVDQLSKLADCIGEYSSKGILTVEGESVRGEEYMEFYVDEEALQQQVLELFYVPVEN